MSITALLGMNLYGGGIGGLSGSLLTGDPIAMVDRLMGDTNLAGLSGLSSYSDGVPQLSRFAQMSLFRSGSASRFGNFPQLGFSTQPFTNSLFGGSSGSSWLQNTMATLGAPPMSGYFGAPPMMRPPMMPPAPPPAAPAAAPAAEEEEKPATDFKAPMREAAPTVETIEPPKAAEEKKADEEKEKKNEKTKKAPAKRAAGTAPAARPVTTAGAAAPAKKSSGGLWDTMKSGLTPQKK